MFDWLTKLHPESLTIEFPEDSTTRSKSRFEFLQFSWRSNHVELDIAGTHNLQWLLEHLLHVSSVLENSLGALDIFFNF